MQYAYYSNLTAKDKTIYRHSDKITAISLPNNKHLIPIVNDLKLALTEENKTKIQRTLKKLAQKMLNELAAPSVNIKLLTNRPSNEWGELQGLYEPRDGKCRARITLWMRTAQQKKVVAFRTFLRTFLHELCHHLDYELLKLADSFHTEGFFKRESSLFKQLVPNNPNASKKPR